MKCSKPLGLQQLRGCIKGNSKLISALLPPQQPLPAPVLVPLGISLYFFHFLEGNLDGDWEWKHLKTSLSSACLVFSAPTTFFLQALGPPNLLTMNGTSAWSWVTSGSPMQEFPGIQLSIINYLIHIKLLRSLYFLKWKPVFPGSTDLNWCYVALLQFLLNLIEGWPGPPGHVVWKPSFTFYWTCAKPETFNIFSPAW